jgi:NAD(P)-dependent dehydrogenase (short-subunit alcohol dehydrogenase family)
VDLELAGRAALITGGSRGIGRAIAQVLAEEGVDLALVARGAEPLAASAREIASATGREVLALPADVRDPAAVERVVSEAAAALGRLDILVSNAGVAGGQAFGPLAHVDDAAVQADLETKFLGALRCCRAVVPHMRRRGFGRLVCVGGLSARYASAYRSERNPHGQHNYAGGPRNLALAHLVRTLSHELGGEGITANVVLPGATRTEELQAQWARRAQREARSLSEIEAEISSSVGAAIGRLVEAREVAYVVAFLASPRAACISGEVVAASGGAGRAVFI